VTYEDFNRFCAALPATTHVVQWGGSQVWKVGGKVFAIGGGDQDVPAYTFKVSPLSFEILKATPGLRPAPYLASRGLSWIQYYAAPGLGDEDLKAYIRESHRLVALGLTRLKRRELGLD
jgi:predicted DNA-binding protein (MmcQ/YjbR family)